MPKEKTTSRLVGSAVIYGFVILVLAFLMTGAGHGWMSGLYSMVAIFLIPFFGAAIANRHRKSALIYGGIAFFGMLLTDYLIMRAAANEGWSYFEQTMPVSGLWLFLWAAWQLGMLWLVFIIAKNRLAQRKQRRDST